MVCDKWSFLADHGVTMPEMFRLLPPAEALEVLLRELPRQVPSERVSTGEALGRVLAETLTAGSPLPSFDRSTMDGYAVRSTDTYGASEGLPAYLEATGEVPMGRAAETAVQPGQAILIHTGGMLPPGADAVVMLEQTQPLDGGSIEVFRAVAPGENTLARGDDIQPGDVLLESGHRLRPQDIGGLMALGITAVEVAARPRVAVISTGDELVPPEEVPGPGQVRDVNTYTVGGIVARAGGVALRAGIVRDDYASLLAAAQAALEESDVLVLSAGSSVSVRDLTARVIAALGNPGVVVHGLALKPGKPTILAVCDGKPVIGLPGNPVSAMVVGGLILEPLLARLQGDTSPPARPRVSATLARNVSSAPGREDYVPVRLLEREGRVWAEPVFGKSNLIYTLVRADGEVLVPLDATGLHEGEPVEVRLF
jgi:molybdopterin molybdotransferase